ncbi:MAG TPA: hypothetical protein VF172_00985, partial [Nitrososphaera sp.]
VSKMGKRKKAKSSRMNTTMVAALDLSDTEGVTTVLSPYGDVTDSSFTIRLDDHAFAQFADRVPKDAKVAFEEATGMVYTLFTGLLRPTATT